MTSSTMPILLSSSASGTPGHMSIDLVFSTAMALGAGNIYITDGAMQTVIDPETGLPALRIVGDTDTHVVSSGSVHFSGSHVTIDGLNLRPEHAYSILMAPGALTTTALRPFAGVTNPAKASFATPAGEAPALVAFEADGSTLRAGTSLTVTLRFSEKVSGLTTAAFTTPGAVLSDLRSDDGITWTARLSAAAANVETSGVIGVDLGAVRDTAGRAAVSSASAPSYLVDTLAPALTSIHLDGTSFGGAQTVGVTFSFSEAVADLPALAINAPHASVTGLHKTDDGHTWTGLLGTADTSPSTGNLLNVDMSKVYDLAGNAGSGTTSSGTAYDITVPAAGIAITGPVAGSTVNVGDALVITFNEAVYLDPDRDYDQVRVANTSTGISSYIFIDERNFSGDHRALTIRADDLQLAGGSDYNIVLPPWLNDGHEVTLGVNSTQVHTTGSYTDTTSPTALRGEVGTSSGWYGDSYGAGTAVTIRIRFSEPVQVVDGQTPTITLNNGGIATYAHSSDDHRELVFVYTVGAADNDTSRLDVADTSALAGKLQDMHGNVMDAAHIQFSHLVNSFADIAIDTHAPAALTGAVLDASSDSGASSSDAITRDSTPTLRGTGAEATALEIRIYDGSSIVGYGYAHSDGIWWATVSAGKDLSDGIHNLTVSQVDQSGNESLLSAAVPVTIKTAKPAALSAPVLDPGSDSGLSDGDGITSNNAPIFHGTGAQANAKIELFSGADKLGGTTADASGNWTITSKPLSTDGLHWVTTRQTDEAGNASDDSPSFKLTIDGSAPVLTSVPGTVATGGAFVLKFSDLVDIPTSVGAVDVYKNGSLLETIAPGDAQWVVETNGTYEYSVLQIAGLADGSYRLDFTYSSPVNMVGIAATNLLLSDILFTVGVPAG